MSAIDSFCFSRASRNLSPADAGNSDASSRGVSVIRFSGGRDATLFFSRLDARCFKAGACCQRLVRDRGVVSALAREYVLIHEFDLQGGPAPLSQTNNETYASSTPSSPAQYISTPPRSRDGWATNGGPSCGEKGGQPVG